MKYCPNCGAEYFDEVKKCADCEIYLVNEEHYQRILETEEEYRKDVKNFVAVETFDNKFFADVVVGALNEERIPFIIKQYQDTAYDGIFELQKGWGTLLVPEKFAQEVETIVTQLKIEFEKNPLDSSPEESEESLDDNPEKAEEEL